MSSYGAYFTGQDDASRAAAPAHVVISDYTMPGMNGAELLKEIAAHARSTGHESLWVDAWKKVSLGETSLEEVLRVLGPEPE